MRRLTESCQPRGKEKLRLSKESLRALSGASLDRVRGGAAASDPIAHCSDTLDFNCDGDLSVSGCC
jgi:hypothetical protein